MSFQNTPTPESKGYKILIVEDEVLIADSIKRYLTKKGHQIIGNAINFDEAIDYLQKEDPDLVLLDIRLNGPKTGIDIAHYIREQGMNTPYIYLTSQVNMKSINEAKTTFPVGYLTKPIQKESLYSTIEIAMHRFDQQKVDQLTIVLTDGKNNFQTFIDDIVFIEANHIYVKIQLSDRQIFQRCTLADLRDQLPSDQFIQTHRSFLINKQKVSRWNTDQVFLKDKIIPISRSRRKDVISGLKQIP